MQDLFRYFAERHKLAWMVTILIIGLGAATLGTINRSQFPNVDLGQMVISTRYPGASPEDVELNVTNKIEDELTGIAGLKRFTSISSENISFITVDLDFGIPDRQAVKDEVREAVGRVTDFPPEVTESPLITDIKTSIFPIIEVGLAGELPYRELRELARVFETQLKEVSGVSDVKRYGYLDREVRIEADPERLRELQVPIESVIAAIQSRNVRATGGTLESYTSEKNVVTLAQFRNPLEVEDVVVRGTYEGPLIKIRDLATVTDGFEETIIDSRLDGRTAISFLVEKAENADIIRTADAIKELMRDFQESLPEGVELLIRYDISRNTRNQFDIVRKNGAFGLVFVFIVLAMFLNWRVSVWVALGVPIAVLGTIFLLPLFGVDLDSITLTAMVIVVGIIVDDAIIISENVYRRRERGDAPLEAAVNGLGEVWMPVVTTVLTTFLAFAPMFFMPGMMGNFVYVIPLTVSLALAVSLTEGFFALPAHLIPGLKRHEAGERRRFDPVGWLLGPFKFLLRTALRLRYLLVLAFFAVLAGALYYAATSMRFILFPAEGADRFVARVELPTGSSLAATSDVMAEVERLIEALPAGEVASYAVRVGAFADLVNLEKENYATLMVDLTPFSRRDRAADEIVEGLRAAARQIEGLETINFQIDAGGPPTGRPVTIRVVGSDDAMRTHLAAAVVQRLAAIDGVVDIERDDKSGKEQIEVDVDYEKLARVGLNVAAIADNVRIAYDGEVVTSVRYGHEDVGFRVTFPHRQRESLETLRSLPIPNDRGRLIRLGDVANLREGPGPSSIQHYKGERSITVTADVVQEKVAAQDATRRAVEGFDLNREYPGMRLVVGGEAEETMESMYGLMAAFVIAVVGIYFLLVLLFDSFVQPFLVLVAVPFGLIGVILAFALHGAPLSFLAMIGTVGLVGVVVNDSLVLVDRLNALRREEPAMRLSDLVMEGTSQRFRAIILTTLTTTAGLLPLAYGLGGSDTYMGPMALALGYGILFATPLTLLLVPSLYLIGADIGGLLRLRRQ